VETVIATHDGGQAPMALETVERAKASTHPPSVGRGEPVRVPSTRRPRFRLAFWAAIATSVVTIVFAVGGIATPARSGTFCAGSCVAYPYVDVARFIPGDYLWLIPGIFLAPTFVVLMACIHSYALDGKKIFSRIAILFAAAYAAIIMVNYFVQFTVVVPSLQAGEIQGLSLFTQYNPHGFFIAVEALAYLLMSTAFLFAAPVFARGRAERATRAIFIVSFVLAAIAFSVLWLVQHDLVAFEVTILMINWIVLIVSGTLLSVVFRRARVGIARGAGAEGLPVVIPWEDCLPDLVEEAQSCASSSPAEKRPTAPSDGTK
jgi:hypothetical protein